MDAPTRIVEAMGGQRSEGEVRAHLRNVEKLSAVKVPMEDCESADGSTVEEEKKKKGVRTKKTPSKAIDTNAYRHFDARMMITQRGGLGAREQKDVIDADPKDKTRVFAI